ncbi:MAG: DUF192 domain-containing protein [Hyphomicrobiaceae bacterium]|nr:DUF192 domain-containing protein [Hyphomicrobiaceae bacterium]MCC0024516.1 DUF192 domain-containing protein [Hyphomicrobiaceae bacterium]
MTRLWGILLGLFLSAFVAGCSADDSLTIKTAKGQFHFSVEIADTPEQQAQGLMFRQELAPDHGMLFDFHRERETAFWMRNTFIPLDMLFIASDGTIRSIHANARPQDDTAIPSGFPVQFVLEIPGGRAAEIGAVPGDKISHVRISKSESSPQ